MDKGPQVFLHVIDTTGPGGAETIFTQLAFETKRTGNKTIALIRGDGWVKSELERLGIDLRILDCKGSFNVKFLKQLINIIRDEKVTHIQAHLLGSSVYASIAGLVSRVPVFSTFHGFVDVSKSERFSFLKFLAIRLGSKAVVAVTDQIRNMLIQIPVMDPKKIFVIANGVDTNIFKPANEFSISPLHQPIKIGCLGNVRNAKNYPLAIQVLESLVAKGVDAELHIAGDDKNKLADECRELAVKYGVSSRLHFVGFISNAAEYLNSLDIYLLSSSSEGHPLALTQAMACGVPVVATRCGIEHVVVDGQTALLAENENADSVVEKLMTVIGSEELRKKMFVLAPASVKNSWSLSSTLMNYLKMYNI